MTNTVAADVVVGLHPLDDVHGERKTRHPGRSGKLVGDVELGGGRILNTVSAPRLLRDAHQQMRLLAAHQIDVAHRPARIARQRGRPDQAGGAVAEQIERGGRRHTLHGWEMAQDALRAPGIAGLIEVKLNRAAGEINDVGGSGSVDVGQPDAAAVEQIAAGRTTAPGPS